MANLVRLFAEQGISLTAVTTPANTTLFRHVLVSKHSTNLLLLIPFPSAAETGLPNGCENTASLPHLQSLHILNLFKAIDLLHKHHPDFSISDWVYTWTTDLSHSLGKPRNVFQFCGSFTNVVCDLIHKHRPHLGINHNSSRPFQILDVPRRIEMMKNELPVIFDHPFAFDRFQDAERKSYGIVMNSFRELEPWYNEFVRGIRKLWRVGSVDLSDHNNNDDDDKQQPYNEMARFQGSRNSHLPLLWQRMHIHG